VEIPSDSDIERDKPTTPNTAHLLPIEFWSPTCRPCLDRLRQLVARKRDFAEKGTTLKLVVILDEDQSTKDAKNVLEQLHIHEAFDELKSEQSITKLELSVLPATWLLGAKNRLLWVAPSGANEFEIECAARHFAATTE